MNLQFLLPKVDGLGVWQIDTGSINSIKNINSDAEMIRAMCNRVSWIPLTLSLEPTEVNNPDDGKKKTVYCLRLRYNGNAESLLKASEKPRLQVLLAAPAEDEAPEDRHLSLGTPEKLEEVKAIAEQDAEDFWPDNTEKPVKETPAEPLQDAAGDKTSGAKAEQTVVIPKDMKTLTDMQKTIFKDIKMQPADQLKELGYSRWADVTETPAECYTRLMAAYYERKEG